MGHVLPAGGADRVGLVVNGLVHGLAEPTSMLDLLGDDGEKLQRAAERAVADPSEVLPLDGVTLRAPIPVPPSIRDFLAFEAHIKTARGGRGLEVDPDWYELPVFYFSNPAGVFGPHDDIAVSPGSSMFDYELEVAAVVGRGGRDLAPGAAEAHIAGYLVMSDWSARDLQLREMQQLLGPAKGKDSATSLGPMLVTPDELAPAQGGNAYRLAMTASVNGREYSRGNLADIYWSFGQLLAYASRGTRLMPGDIIGSGTVGSGCILELSSSHSSEEYPWLQPGDEVLLEVEQLGAISARIIPGRPPIPLR